MSKHGTGKFLLGAGIGAGIALLLAPKKGEELRKDVLSKISEICDKLKDVDEEEVKANIEKKVQEIKDGIKDLDAEKVKEIAVKKGELNNKYSKDDSGIELKILGNNYKLVTKEKENEYLKSLALETSNNLSDAALETLAIIAYNEPVTRFQIDEIRGINSSQMLRNLISKGLIEVIGKDENAPGRPNLYKTTNEFLDYFNLSNISELPEIEEIEEILEDDDLYNSRYREEEVL